MRGEILPPRQDVINNIPALADKSNEFQSLGGGGMQLTLRHRDIGVLHVSSNGQNLSQDETLICNRWVYPHKGGLIAEAHNRARHLHRRVAAPEIIMSGEINNTNYSYWYDTFIQGTDLTQLTFTSIANNLYPDLIQWVAKFHESKEYASSLLKYYSARLSAFRNIFSTEDFKAHISENDIALLLSLVDWMRNSIMKIIEDTENVSSVHGDLWGGNILVSDSKITVLDFEQGIHGGDWYADINRLINPQSDSMPDTKRPYRYVSPLQSVKKRQLLTDYASEREKWEWKVPNFLKKYIETGDTSQIKERSKLCALDNMLSVLVLRYLYRWNFYINNETGQRGVDYLVEFIRKKVDTF